MVFLWRLVLFDLRFFLLSCLGVVGFPVPGSGAIKQSSRGSPRPQNQGLNVSVPPYYRRKNGKPQAGLPEGSAAVVNDKKSPHSHLTAWTKQECAAVLVSGLGEHSGTSKAAQTAGSVDALDTWLSFCLVPA